MDTAWKGDIFWGIDPLRMLVPVYRISFWTGHCPPFRLVYWNLEKESKLLSLRLTKKNIMICIKSVSDGTNISTIYIYI